MKFCLALTSFVLAASATQAAAPYLDDRSSAERLIASFYNAINRKEYARAFSYLEDQSPAKYAGFAQGYAATDEVEVIMGGVASDGAAGSMYYHVPVALWARGADGKHQVFAGCYVVRQINATIQDPPFKGLSIAKGNLKQVKGENPTAVPPAACDGMEAISAEEAQKQKVINRYVRDHEGKCERVEQVVRGEMDVERHSLTYRMSYDAADHDAHKATLFVFPCGFGAYNTTEVYYLQDGDEAPQQISFAVPDYEIKYEGDTSEKLKSLTLRGFATQDSLVNSAFDPQTGEISSFSKWRGIGDASSTGTWVLKDARFVLKNYEVDPTYDGAENPLELVREGKVLAEKLP